MPEHAEPPAPRPPASSRDGTQGTQSGGGPRRGLLPPTAVLVDFHGTLAQVEDALSWVQAAAQACGAVLTLAQATILADRLVTAGRAGGPPPSRVPPHLAEVYAHRDLYEYANHAAYTGLHATVAATVSGLPEALYQRWRSPEGWVAYPSARRTLLALRAAGVRVGLVSNIGFDIRPILVALELADLLDACVLSVEAGRTKPDPAIFAMACAALGVSPSQALMVGDKPADANAVAAGCRAYLVPEAPAGQENGLALVLALIGTSVPEAA